MAALYPDREETPEAREGTAAHWVAERFLERQLRALEPPQLFGETAPNGVRVDQPMLDGVRIYTNDVRSECIKRGIFGGDNLGVETPLMMPQIHPLNGGTPDLWMHDQRARELVLWDFKYGFRVVQAFENWQLIDYAAGLANRLGIDGFKDQFYKVTLKIVQPRAFGSPPVKSWTVPLSDLRPYWNDLARGAAETVSDDPQARPGKPCLTCSARHVCPALRAAASQATAYAQSATPENLPADAVGVELYWLEWAQAVIEARSSGLREEAEHRIRNDQPVPGYTMKPGRGRTVWTLPDEQVIRMGEMLGTDLRKRGALTPNQARDEGVNPDVVDQFTKREPGSLKLTVDNGTEAKRVFSQ